jgi:hypothetical protein
MQHFIQLRYFKMEIVSLCYKYALSAELKKHMCLSKENNLCYKLQHLAHCFSVIIELVFEQNTACKTQLTRCREAHFVPNRPSQLSWRNTCISWKETIRFRSRSILHIVFKWELCQFLKGMLPAILVFQGGDRLYLLQIGLFSWVEVTRVPPQETHVYYKLQHLAPWFLWQLR